MDAIWTESKRGYVCLRHASAVVMALPRASVMPVKQECMRTFHGTHAPGAGWGLKLLERDADDAEQAVLFVVGACRVEQRVGLMRQDAVAELDRPQAVDVQLVAV